MANWASVANLGDPSQADWQAKNLTWIEPVKGQRWQVYAPAAQAFQGLLGDLVARGYQPTSSGGFNYRNIRGSDKLSQHAFGTAIDLNAMTNPMGGKASDIPDAADLAKKWGLEWGGNWKGRPDPMHFEYTGTAGTGPSVLSQQPTVHAPSVGSPEEAAARSSKPLVSTAPTPTYAVEPGVPKQGPPTPATAPPQPPGMFADLRKKLGEAMTGYKMPAMAENDTNLAGLAMPAAARVDTPELPSFDPNQIANQRQSLALAMQRLNSGRLFG